MGGQAVPLLTPQSGNHVALTCPHTCLLQKVKPFVEKVNSSGGNFEVHFYEDAGHAFLNPKEQASSYALCLPCFSCTEPCCMLNSVLTAASQDWAAAPLPEDH